MKREDLIYALNIKAIGMNIPYLQNKIDYGSSYSYICFCNNCYDKLKEKRYCCVTFDGYNNEEVQKDNFCFNCGEEFNWDKVFEFYREVEYEED